jgi:hypothetical protein
MPEVIKVLGQVTTSAAGSTQLLSLFPDPNGEYVSTTSQTWFEYPNQSILFGVPTDNGGGVGSNCQSGYRSDLHYPNTANSTGRSNVFGLKTHSNQQRPLWKMSTNTNNTPALKLERPYLDSGQVYTLYFNHYGEDDSGHGNHGHNQGGIHYSRGVNQYDIVPYTGSFFQHYNATYGWNDDSSALNIWKTFYTTFTGEGGLFDLSIQLRNHNYNGWKGVYFDNFTLLKGAVPLALIPLRPTDGASGNANALYTSPYTIKSEGWSTLPYQSPTIRKVTGSWQTLYTVPENTSAVASTLSVSNFGTSATTYRIAVQKYGETLSSKHILAFDHPIPQTSNESHSIGITLAAGDKIIVQSDVDKVNFQLFGSEIS